MKTKILASLLIATSLVSGCENPKQTLGTIGGGALGAWAGSTIGGGSGRIVAAAVGGVLGALGGSYIGGQLDKADKAAAEKTAHQCLESSPTGQASQWTNPDNKHSGTITPVRTFQNAQGAHCREFQQTVTIGGKTEKAYGTACRQPDGHWKIQ